MMQAAQQATADSLEATKQIQTTVQEAEAAREQALAHAADLVRQLSDAVNIGEQAAASLCVQQALRRIAVNEGERLSIALEAALAAGRLQREMAAAAEAANSREVQEASEDTQRARREAVELRQQLSTLQVLPLVHIIKYRAHQHLVDSALLQQPTSHKQAVETSQGTGCRVDALK